MINSVGSNVPNASVQLSDSSKVNVQIDKKVEQGRYPIDLDIVTAKMFESFREAES